MRTKLWEIEQLPLNALCSHRAMESMFEGKVKHKSTNVFAILLKCFNEAINICQSLWSKREFRRSLIAGLWNIQPLGVVEATALDKER